MITYLILNACSQGALSDGNSPGTDSGTAPYLSVELKADDANSKEGQIAKIRTIVVNGADQIVTNTVSTPDAPVDDIFRLIAKANFGNCSVHLICNETTELTEKLNRLNQGSEIDEINYSVSNLTPPLTMYTKVSNIRIDYDQVTKTTKVYQDGELVSVIRATVVRTMAKLSFVLIKNIEQGDKFSVESLSFQVCQIPRHSHLAEDLVYDPTDGWADNIAIDAEGAISVDGDGSYIDGQDGGETTPGTEKITAPSVYLPGHLLHNEEDNVNCSYLLLEAKCKREGSSTLINAKYRIDLGKNPPVNLNLSRNTHYRVYATIKNMGATGIYAEIVPLKEYNTPIVWKTLEGYTIMGESLTEHSNDIWNNYSQYSGILKIKDATGKYRDALFRYGSVIALESATTASNFTSSSVLWKPPMAPSITSWNDLKYLEENISDQAHNATNIALGKGDPCRLIGLTSEELRTGTIDNKTWRMPTSAEMAWLLNAKSSTLNTKGFYSYNYLVTPNTGFRTETGVMTPAAKKGYYWSSTQASALLFNSADNTGSIVVDDPQKAYAIRCIRTSIPRSRLAVTEAIIDYHGQVDIPLEITDLFLKPYWKMEVEPSTTTGITFTKSEGTYNEHALVTVSPTDNPYDAHFFKIKVTGYGLDGNVDVVYTQIRQVGLSHSIALVLDNSEGFPTSGGYLRVPAKATRLGFKIAISPELEPPYDALIGHWQAHVSYFDTKSRRIIGTEASIGETSYIDLPKNDYGHTIALYFVMKPVDETTFPPYTSQNLIFVHEKEL